MQPKPTGLLHDAHKNQTRVLRLLQNNKIARWVLCFEAKSATEKFDLTDVKIQYDVALYAIQTPSYVA